MSRLSPNEIRKEVEQMSETETPKTPAEVLAAHTEAMRPKYKPESDVRPDSLTDTRPRWQGKLVAPLSKT